MDTRERWLWPQSAQFNNHLSSAGQWFPHWLRLGISDSDVLVGDEDLPHLEKRKEREKAFPVQERGCAKAVEGIWVRVSLGSRFWRVKSNKIGNGN